MRALLERIAPPRRRPSRRPGGSRCQPSPAAPGSGFTLIEVILALAILGGALTVIGEIVQLADRNASDAQALARAQLLADSVLDELLAGSIELSDVARQPLADTDRVGWLLTITQGTSEVEGVIPVEVTVEQDLEPAMQPVRFRVVRWFSTLVDESAPTDGSNGTAPTSPATPASGGGL